MGHLVCRHQQGATQTPVNFVSLPENRCNPASGAVQLSRKRIRVIDRTYLALAYLLLDDPSRSIIWESDWMEMR